MTLRVPLSADEQAKLIAKAEARGVSADALLRIAVLEIIASDDPAATQNKPNPSLLGLWAHHGPGPSEEDIDRNRSEMFSSFGRDDIA